MIPSLPDRRARFLLDAERADILKELADSLKDAPLRVRRLGLPLAVAMWSQNGPDLVELLARWLFDGWGMFGGYAVPQGAVAMLRQLMEVEKDSPALRSALEVEAEEILQAAKVLSAALTGGQDG